MSTIGDLVDASLVASLLDGLATHLETVGIATYSLTTPVPDPGIAVVINAMPETPDRIVSLTTYSVADDPALIQGVVGLQVRVRGGEDPRESIALDDACFDAFQTLTGLFGSVWVTQMYRQSGAPLGQDANDRWERSSNYYIDVSRPSTHRE